MDVMPSSPNSNNAWFAALQEEVDDPMLQVFVGDCLVDYPAEDMNMGALLMEDNYTLSPESECNSSSAAAEITNNSNSNSHSEFNQHDTAPAPAAAPNTKRPRRLPDQSQNHIIAERRRRQNLSQRFIALSALIPGLKKMDKTTVLGEAITHMKQLKERVKILEEDKARRAVESVVVVQRSRVLVVENESNSSTSNDTSHSTAGVTHDEQFPQVEARFSNTSVLIKVHCQMQIGILSKIINKIENIHLSVTTTCSMPFNSNTLDITIMTRMEPDFDMEPQQVVENIRSIF